MPRKNAHCTCLHSIGDDPECPQHRPKKKKDSETHAADKRLPRHDGVKAWEQIEATQQTSAGD
ncbi:hypothetical protein A2773_00355 [Candidatus Gottesmanbacteria bacterium RIFCSPHIGHO2_01_FULL_39_10]|uniref:Uncharacterized protein n=1 Tax=Candidatus Gottesmanbacteria bacterium RIFCSPHIGHO2_01_FULL_39_10 TaxID=1798375 RepID=A0A1F5ZKM0_9BACT|nr:MAG: hypothetical protein A2773_00355 [Candidatus Gottesmanbacteria bacterium RIFCSPHIGHO2_01_FULL_39_10]